MKILIVDRDEIPAQLIGARLSPIGHEVVHEPDKSNLAERIKAEQYDIIMIDPSPVSSPRSFILKIRSSVGAYPYVILMSETLVSRAEAIKGGVNDIIAKPLDMEGLDQKILNAQSLLGLIKRLGDGAEDFPSAGGIIAKSAFNQLFLSSIDRADRYGERTYVLRITINNYKEIVARDGQSSADNVAAQLSRCLVKLRRQSDIIGQTGRDEYMLLLHNAGNDEKEPLEATSRFAESLLQSAEISSVGTTQVELAVSLSDLPVGFLLARHIFTPATKI